MNNTINTLAEVKAFFTLVIGEFNVTGFHPDGDFLDYVQMASGKRTFTPEIAEDFNTMLANCFAVCEASGADIYEIGLGIMNANFEKALDTFKAGADKLAAFYGQTIPAKVVAKIVTGYGMWQHPIAVENALCFDGKRRKVRLNQDGQTGRCTIGKKTLKGFISYVGSASCGDIEDYQFIAYNEQ